MSSWIYLYDSNTKGGIKIRKGSSSTVLTEQYVDTSYSSIDGWRKLDVEFTSPASGNVIIELRSARLTGTNGTYAFFDDIRLQPFNSSIKTFVYDASRLWLIAELDNKNYATFYNYDEEGILTQIKKETERGIMTVQSTRSNTKKTSP